MNKLSRFFARFSMFLIVFAVFAAVSSAQQLTEMTLKVMVVDKDLNVKNVPKFGLVVSKPNSTDFTAINVSTSLEGTASVSLADGDYLVSSDKPLEFAGRTFVWSAAFTVGEGKPKIIELSNDNATISQTISASRRVTEEGELFKTLRDGVVAVEGDFGDGSGFIVDKAGIIITNQHVIGKSNEVRVRFDKKTAVRARILGQDTDRDIAILQVNLSACPACKVLDVVTPSATEPTVIEGERVFAIGSPLFQDKILTSGIVSKVEKRAVISDVAINPGNSGGPLFNLSGEVIGIATFGVQAPGGPGVAGIVRIEETQDLLKAARDKAATLSLPVSELMPNMPEGSFPIDAIKTQVNVSKFPQKSYEADIKNYDISFITPVFKFWSSEKHRLASQNDRNKRNEKNGATDTVDRFRDLRNWNEYAGELRPVVDIVAMPEAKASKKSLFLTITGAVGGVLIPPDVNFKADFFQMKLMCNREEILPIKRRKVEFGADLINYFTVKTRYTYAGVYSYPHEAFEPGKCPNLELYLFSEANLEVPTITPISPITKQRIWDDFLEYRKSVEK